MAREVKLPRLGQGMESGSVVKWLKAEGDAVEKGQPLYELDTDKVTQEVEAEASGVLLKIVVPEGEVPVGTTLALIGEAGEEVDAPKAEEAPPEEPSEEPEPSEARPSPVAAVTAAPPERQEGERIKASPLARRLAREQGVDLASVKGTGPEGRIVAEDVERLAPAAAPPVAAAPDLTAPEPAPAEPARVADDVERVPLTSIRRTIARRLTEAWKIPVYQLVLSADMEAVNQLVERRRELDPEERVTVTDVLVKVCAAALMRHRAVNVQFTEEELLVFPYANVGIAVATERGLIVPVIHGAEHLSLAEVAAARADVVTRAREGGLRQRGSRGRNVHDLQPRHVRAGSVRRRAQSAAGGHPRRGASQERPVVRDGEIVARPTMTMTLTCDHRAVDGAPAAEFLETVKAMLEDLSLALMIRRGDANDTAFLRDMLRHAYYWRWEEPELRDLPVSRYVEGWGRPGDRALILIEGFQPVAAAWYRLFTETHPGYGFVDEQTPELTIAVVPSRRGRGYGAELLTSLLAQAAEDGFAAISLSVEPDNPALALYERHGFEKVGERGGALVMRAQL